MQEYTTLEEKKSFIKNGNKKVDFDIEGIFKKLDKFAEQGTFIFRGSTEAKYKLFNSAQRVFIQLELYLQTFNNYEELYDDWIEQLIEDCKKWNSGTVVKFFKESRINENNSIAYLSYMQHYGVPTPFLDFTHDPYIALFFAINKDFNKPSNNEIDNYFSVYYTYTNNNVYRHLNDFFEKSIPDIKKGIIFYKDVSKSCLQLIHPDNKNYRLFNNANIINQKGCFFYNNNPFKPIEECYSEFIKPIEMQLSQKEFDDYLLNKEIVGCINIHKSLIPYIKNKLISKGITKEFLFPDPYKIKDYVLHNSVAKIINSTKPKDF